MNRVWMITGAGRGLGHAFAEEAVKNGEKVIATVRKINDTDPLMKNENVLPVIMDVTKKEEVTAAVDAGIKKFGRIDVLINNAQASASGVPLVSHTLEQFDLALYSGLYATFHYMQAAYPYLKEAKGCVINFASGAGFFGNVGQCAYAAAKEGIRGLSRVAATEWAKEGIHVLTIAPLAWTAQLEKFSQAYPDAFAKNVHTPPAGYFGRPEEDIGRVLVRVAHPDFKYMTGETLTLEGGLGLRP